MTAQSKAKLRKAILKRRKQLSKTDLYNAANDIRSTAFANQTLYATLTDANYILSYVANHGEISPASLVSNLEAKIYLPKIMDFVDKSLQFFRDNQDLISNRYGIQEPIGVGNPITMEKIDLILIPLVAFDEKGNRIGLGGGFYDRFLANLPNTVVTIGLAHHFQQLESIQPDVWDIPIDAILTDRKLIDPAKRFVS
ncbi:MAG: 5-formyltetrahydrofolate cyclo-ligase [Acidiferrobacterales bacterium]|nr:5-formyltetrahydrofolate cyclo-ligase [Acidiferrobacterales bacterium]